MEDPGVKPEPRTVTKVPGGPLVELITSCAERNFRGSLEVPSAAEEIAFRVA